MTPDAWNAEFADLERRIRSRGLIEPSEELRHRVLAGVSRELSISSPATHRVSFIHYLSGLAAAAILALTLSVFAGSSPRAFMRDSVKIQPAATADALRKLNLDAADPDMVRLCGLDEMATRPFPLPRLERVRGISP